MLLREIKNVFHKELDSLYAKEEVDSFFYMLIEHYLKLERFVLALEPNLTVSKVEEDPFFDALSKLKLQKPIQYIIGSTIFLDLEFKVNANVLIPRPETEELVRWIIAEVQNIRSKLAYGRSLNILDVGTGSGCIAIALAKNISEAKVYAIDVSEKALETAKENAIANKVNVRFLKENMLDLESLDMKFDIIVSNPPYVRTLEKKQMNENVLQNEPGLALFVADENPLLFYKTISNFAASELNNNGMLFFEINQYLGKETERLLRDHNFSEIELRKDIFENDRMLKGVWYE